MPRAAEANTLEPVSPLGLLSNPLTAFNPDQPFAIMEGVEILAGPGRLPVFLPRLSIMVMAALQGVTRVADAEEENDEPWNMRDFLNCRTIDYDCKSTLG